MNNRMYDVVKNNYGFIAALDQSGGSTAKTLKLYGIDEDRYNSEEEMFDLVHEMRSRIISSASFISEHLIGVILFKKTMDDQIEGIDTADYLWEKKRIPSFLKIDNGLLEEENGVQLMKEIPELDSLLGEANNKHIFGTKMRSVIKRANKVGISAVVKQQFELAKRIASFGLVPIIEPEVDINAPDKLQCEMILKEEISKELLTMEPNMKIMFKFTLPEVDNFYLEYVKHPNVVRVVALSGGYSREVANQKLKKNLGVVASFSRALLSDLNVNQSKEEFDKALKDSILSIYEASI